MLKSGLTLDNYFFLVIGVISNGSYLHAHESLAARAVSL
jgi:hypothetical protein